MYLYLPGFLCSISHNNTYTVCKSSAVVFYEIFLEAASYKVGARNVFMDQASPHAECQRGWHANLRGHHSIHCAAVLPTLWVKKFALLQLLVTKSWIYLRSIVRVLKEADFLFVLKTK